MTVTVHVWLPSAGSVSVTADAVVTVFEIAEPVNVYDWIDAPDPADADTASCN